MTLVARGVIVHENECLQCQNFHTSLAGWCTYSAEESDAFPVLFCTAAGSYIALNDVQMANNKHGHDTPHCDLSYIRNKCKLITYLFRNLLYSKYEILCPLVSFSFYQLHQFLLLARSASVHTNCQQASTNCPCTDTETRVATASYNFAYSSSSCLFLHSLTKIQSSQAIFHIYLFSLL